jgi:hypothetical protein
MFSWLSNSIPDYPETLNLKMYAHIQDSGDRPERVKEIMMRRLDLPEI